MPTGCTIGRAALKSLTRNYGHMIGLLEDEETDFFDALKERVLIDPHTDADTQRLRAFECVDIMRVVLADRLMLMSVTGYESINAFTHPELTKQPRTREGLNALIDGMDELAKSFHADLAEIDLTETVSGVGESNNRGFDELTRTAVGQAMSMAKKTQAAARELRSQLGAEAPSLGNVGMWLMDCVSTNNHGLLHSLRLIEGVLNVTKENA